MTNTASFATTEDELDTLVSIAIRRAEILDDEGSPAADEAWHEVSAYEQRLAAITAPSEIAGGVARVGAVRAALAAGHRAEAESLASKYLAETQLPAERRAAMERVFQEDRDRRARHFPAIAKSGRLAELAGWRAAAAAQNSRVFPMSEAA
jgi:hypothetical protein